MASIRRRGKSWQAQVRSRTFGSISKSFHCRRDADCWATEQEALMQNGAFASTSISTLTLRDLLKTYLEKVTPTKRGAPQEIRRIARLMQENELLCTPLVTAQPHIFASFRDRRVKDGVRACQYDLVLLKHAWNIARIEWGWPLGDNPVALVRMPRNNPPGGIVSRHAN